MHLLASARSESTAGIVACTIGMGAHGTIDTKGVGMRSPRRLAPDVITGLDGAETPPPASSLFWTMWNASVSTAQDALGTEFIQGIAAGNLDPVRYGGFNVNDAYYCFNGADDYLSASNRASDSGLESFLRAKYESYLKYNETFPTTWRVQNGDSVIPYPACALYSLYERLIAVVSPPIYSVIVMIPCEYLWAWLAAQLAPPDPSNLYAPWITENNDPSGAYKMGNYLDTYMAANPGVVDQDDAVAVFRQAMTFELENFAAAATVTATGMHDALAMSDTELLRALESRNSQAISGDPPPAERGSGNAIAAEALRRDLAPYPSDWAVPPAT